MPQPDMAAASGPPAHSAAARGLLGLLAGYRRFISPVLGPRCRFYPTCSAYAVEAVSRYGAGKGSVLAVRRLLRCHPFHPGGHDPVPVRHLADDPASPVTPSTPPSPRSMPGA